MVELTDNCAECGGIFTIGDWATLYVDGWIHQRCKPPEPEEPLAQLQRDRKTEVQR